VIHLVGGGKTTFDAVSNQAVQRFFFAFRLGCQCHAPPPTRQIKLIQSELFHFCCCFSCFFYRQKIFNEIKATTKQAEEEAQMPGGRQSAS